MVYCTPGRARKAVVALTTVSLILSAITTLVNHLVSVQAVFDIYAVLFLVLPLSILVINLLVVREVRRASNFASTNLGLHQSQQTTTSNSAVPTMMLITTSLIYVFLSCAWSICHIYFFWLRGTTVNDDSDLVIYFTVSFLQRVIFVYNFFVYLITGRQFRSELRTLCCCCCCCCCCCKRTLATDAGGADGARPPRSGRRFATSRV